MEELNKENFDDKTGSGVVVVDFWAPWCGPCKQLGPIFEETAGEVDGAEFFKVNVDDNQDLAQKFGIMSIPCVIVFNDGEEADRIMGFPGPDQFKEMLTDAVDRLQ